MKKNQRIRLAFFNFSILFMLFIVDIKSALGLGIWIFYILPLLLSIWFADNKIFTANVLLITVFVVLGFFFSPFGVEPSLAILNRGFFILTVWVMYLAFNFIRKAKIEHEEALLLKNFFLAITTYELRVPLAKIDDCVDYVSKGFSGEINEKQKEYLAEVKKNITRIMELSNNILDYQKLNAGPVPLHLKRGDLHAVIQEVIRTMAPSVFNKELDIALKLGSAVPKVLMDEEKIKKVLSIILHSVIRFNPESKISIDAQQLDGLVKLTVVVNEMFIERKDTPKIFSDFSYIEKKYGGTGLEFSIAKRLIEAHKGRIWVESEPDKGTIFSFTLPVSR